MAKAKTKRGRPTKITETLVSEIVEHIRFGNYVEVASALAGINKETFYAWLKRGARESRGIYTDFSNAIKKAQAESENADVQNITAAGASGQWQASAWRLERKFPARWGRKDKIEHSGTVNLNFDADDKDA